LELELTLHRYFCTEPHNEAHLAAAEPLPQPGQQGSFGPSGSFFSKLAKEAGVHLVGSLFEKSENGDNTQYFNTAVVFGPNGELVGRTRKVHIPSGTGYNETHYFQSGLVSGEEDLFPVHDLGFIKIATPTCYDQWFPELSRIYAMKGVELIVYPTAIGSEPDHPQFDSAPMWHSVIRAQGIMNGVFVAAVNRTGNDEGGLVRFYGSSFVSDPCGKVLVEASRDQPQLLVTTLDFDTFGFWRKLFPLLRQRQPAAYQPILDQVN
jgi:N-carbamoylputrescine amidase